MLAKLFGWPKAEAPDLDLTYLAGAYRRHRDGDVARFTRLTMRAFPHYAGRIECFGMDWRGGQFAIDRARTVRGEPLVLRLDVDRGEAEPLPTTLASFHGQFLLREPDTTVAYRLFDAWLGAGGGAPRYEQCVGCKVPLFLGGRAEFGNLDLIDVEVHWEITGRMLAGVSAMPGGALSADRQFGDRLNVL